MGLFGFIKRTVSKPFSWVSGGVKSVWNKVPEFKFKADIKVDHKLRVDSADIRVGLEAIAQGLDSVGAGIQTGLSEVGAGIGTAGISLGQSFEGGATSLAQSVASLGISLHEAAKDFDPSGGVTRRLLTDFDDIGQRMAILSQVEHYFLTEGQPLQGDHLVFRLRNESNVERNLLVDAVFAFPVSETVAPVERRIQVHLTDVPKPNEPTGWEPEIVVPYDPTNVNDDIDPAEAAFKVSYETLDGNTLWYDQILKLGITIERDGASLQDANDTENTLDEPLPTGKLGCIRVSKDVLCYGNPDFQIMVTHPSTEATERMVCAGRTTRKNNNIDCDCRLSNQVYILSRPNTQLSFPTNSVIQLVEDVADVLPSKQDLEKDAMFRSLRFPDIALLETGAGTLRAR